MDSAFQALSPQQVNSWPKPTPQTTLAGEPLRYFGATSKEGFLQLAQERFKLCAEAAGPQRKEQLEDQNFAAGIQWDKDIENSRRGQDRPCLTINRIDGFLAHAVNNMRQARPSIRIEPVADGADEEIASIDQGLIRHIQVNSSAETVYDESFRGMATGGLAWMRVVDDWAAPDSFDQELFIRWVPNPFSVYSDPFVQQPDWSDMKYAFIVEDLTRAEFKAQYGEDTEAANLGNFQSIGDQAPFWFPGGKIRVAEYFHVEQRKDTLCEMEDGKTKLLSDLNKTAPGQYVTGKNADGDGRTYLTNGIDRVDVGRSRPCLIPEVYWAKITALDVLRERKWKGPHIPLVPVIGNQTEVDGERVLVGMVRYAREPQRMYNYMYTSFVEMVALAPRAPFVAEIDQIPDGVTEMWQKANSSPQAYLLYKAKTMEGGQLVPPPQRQQAEPPIQAFVQGLQMADQNLKSVFRIFEASLGQRGPQESGLAINARKIESDTGTYNWGDNFIRALEYLGKILLYLLPHYYNTPGKIFHILQDDDSKKKVIINQEFQENGVTKKFDLAEGGRLAVVVSTGPDQQTVRKESAAGMVDFFKLYPAGLQACAHILVGELDFPGKDKIRKQLEKILPSNLQEPDPDAPEIPQAFQAQMAQAMQQIQLLSNMLGEATDKNVLERMKQDYETLRTQMHEEVVLATAEMKAGTDEAKFMSEKIFAELEQIRALTQANISAPKGGAAPAAAAPPPTALATPGTAAGIPSVGGI